MQRYEKCLRCGRKLKTIESQELGFGKTCWAKFNSEDNFKELFPADCLTKKEGPERKQPGED